VKIYVACLHDARRVPAVMRALISQTGQMAFVGMGLRYLCSCATPAVPEFGGGEAGESPPRLGRRRSRLDPRTPVRDRRCSSRRSAPPSVGFPSPSRATKEGKSIDAGFARMALLPPCHIFLLSPVLRLFSSTCMIPRTRPYLPLVNQAAKGAPLLELRCHGSPRSTA
jgi:hypothetical protein